MLSGLLINWDPERESLTQPGLSELDSVNVYTRVKQLKLNHVHEIVYNKCPSYMYRCQKIS